MRAKNFKVHGERTLRQTLDYEHVWTSWHREATKFDFNEKDEKMEMTTET